MHRFGAFQFDEHLHKAKQVIRAHGLSKGDSGKCPLDAYG